MIAQKRWRDAVEDWDEKLGIYYRLRIDRPPALFFQPGDGTLGLHLPSAKDHNRRDYYGDDAIEAIRRGQHMAARLKPHDELPPAGSPAEAYFTFDPTESCASRIVAIVEAHREHQEACRKAKKKLGLLAAEKAMHAAQRKYDATRKRALGTRPGTLKGVLALAQLVKQDGGFEHSTHYVDEVNPITMLGAVLDDLARAMPGIPIATREATGAQEAAQAA
jgi:hypothetical protein